MTTMESSTLTAEIFETDPNKVFVKDGLPRVRNELGEIEKLLASFEKFGQLQPIVVNRSMELIAGGRRLAACLLGNRKVLAVYKDTVDPLTMREMELEENIQRKELTPAEEVLAVDEIHKLKQQIHGVSVSGKKGGWGLEKTAEIIGKTKSAVLDDLMLADALKQFPSLSECKTKSEMRKAVKGINKMMQTMSAVAQYEQTSSNRVKLYNIKCADALEHMLEQDDKSVDLLLTDPIYGINIDENSIGVGGQTGGFSTTGFKYSDTPEEALKHYEFLAKQSYRFCKDNAHALIFTSPTNFCALRDFFRNVGWLCSDRPVIWVKNETGQNNNPDKWFSSTYEVILFARKVDSRLIVEGKPDWIQYPPVIPSERLHQAQKPIQLLTELIKRTTLPGKVLYDPFMGSGSSIIAGLEMKLFPIGCDIAEESYNSTLYRITEWEKAHDVV